MASCEVWIEEIITGAHEGNGGCASHSFLRHSCHFMEDEAMAGWLLLAMDRVSNFVRILWLSGPVEGSGLRRASPA